MAAASLCLVGCCACTFSLFLAAAHASCCCASSIILTYPRYSNRWRAFLYKKRCWTLFWCHYPIVSTQSHNSVSFSSSQETDKINRRDQIEFSVRILNWIDKKPNKVLSVFARKFHSKFIQRIYETLSVNFTRGNSFFCECAERQLFL